MNKLIKKAQVFAIAAHDSIAQQRKYSNAPYHVHPARVASIVAEVTDDPEVIAAAWLHDVLEDVAPYNANFNEQAIRDTLGSRVLTLVLEVTDISKLSDGNRAVRKAIDREHLSRASMQGKTIKLADLIDNYIDIKKHDPGFARIFRSEGLLLLPLLKEGNMILYQRLQILFVE